MSEWKEYRLGEICKVKGGKRLPKGNNLTTVPNAHPYIRVRDMGEKYLPINNLEYVPNEVFPSIKNYIVDKGDLLLSIVGTVGLVSLVNDELDKASLTENCVKIIPQKDIIDNEFLYYFIKSNIGQEEIFRKIVGAVQPKLPIYNINDIGLNIPDLPTQTAIAEILSSLDDKIELNNKINQELETLAQTLFKQWFIDFEFPNENGEPFKSSGGEMVDSALGEIPKGWEVGTIESLTQKMNSGGTPSTRNADYYDGNIIWYSTKELKDNFIFDSERTITLSGLNNSSAKLFPTNTVVMAIYAAPTVGRLGILSQESAFNQAALGFVAKVEVGYEFMYLLLKYLRDDFNNLANGAAQQNLNVGLVKNFKILMPLIEPLAKFQSLMKPVFESIKNNQLENNSLTKTRDTLLPKLISGELEINELPN